MFITVSGEKKNVQDGVSITKLIEILEIENPNYVSVSVNEEFVDRNDFEVYKLKENDVVEFLYFMGGGNIWAIPREA